MFKSVVATVILLGCCYLFNAYAVDVPSYMNVVVAKQKPLSKSQLAARDVLNLDTDMQAIYNNNLGAFEQNLLNQHPVILALFSNGGGKFYLYRPGRSVLIAPPVPEIYSLTKSVAHSSMATYQVLIRYVSNAKNDPAWRAPARKFLLANEIALQSVDQLDVSSQVKQTLKNVLNRNINFINTCLKNDDYSLSDIEAYTQSQNKDLMKLIGYATEAQVNHWVAVLSRWKRMLGSQWNQVYAVSNTLYVTRRRNILFTILAQFMGKSAINDRLLLFGTTSFTTTPKAVLSELTRIVSDRSIGKIFFGNKMQMDVELLGEGARTQLKKDQSKLPHPLLLPPKKSLETHKFPW